MVGMPVAIVLAVVPFAAQVLVPPLELGVWWVDAVARVANWCEPASSWPGILVSLLLTCGVVVIVASRKMSRLRARHND
jgi:hypothetical protein